MSKLGAFGATCAFMAGTLLGPSGVPHARAAIAEPAAGAASPGESALAGEAEASGASLEGQAQALALRWAPVFVQHASAEHPERDRPLPVDFDGDWRATNNWRHLTPDAAHVTPVVYGSAILTATHAYLTYTLFYPRDWQPYLCFSYACHDNDLEVLLVVVERGSATDSDRLVLVETKAHRSFVPLRGRDVARAADLRPIVEVESEGHGMYAVSRGSFPEGATRLFAPQGGASVSTTDSAQPVERYELVSLHESLWRRRTPSAERGELWSEGESGWLAYAGSRSGRQGWAMGASMAGSVYRGGVRPPWALRADGERGDWFLDPVVPALSRYAAWFAGRPTARKYVFNPYLDDLQRECVGRACPRLQPAEPQLALSPALLAAVLALGFAWHRLQRRAV